MNFVNVRKTGKGRIQGSSGRRRPRRPGSSKLSFPSLKSSCTSQYSSTAFVLGDPTSGIQSRSLRTETRNLKIVDVLAVLRRPGRFHRESNIFDSLGRKVSILKSYQLSRSLRTRFRLSTNDTVSTNKVQIRK